MATPSLRKKISQRFAVNRAPFLLRKGVKRSRSQRPAPYLPMTRAEMDRLGWKECDVILITGDAYIDHPSFGMALVGRLLEAQGFRVGIIAQPDWSDASAFRALGRPRLYFGVTAGNMDSMVNRYTSDKRIRSNDAYTPDGAPGKRPDRSVLVYANRCREAFKGVPVVIGGIEASLRRIAHFDYWSEKVRRSILFDAKADILLYGNAERALVELTHRLDQGESVSDIKDLRGTAFARRGKPFGWKEIKSDRVDTPGKIDAPVDPYQMKGGETPCADADKADIKGEAKADATPEITEVEGQRYGIRPVVIRLPSFEAVKGDPVLYAHASRVLHREANPGNARALIQAHGNRDLWINPPPIPLTTQEMDAVYELPYKRLPHPSYGKAKIPAYDMIRFSITIQRGCFGGCTFCSITEHEGRIIQNRSHESVIKEVQAMQEVPGFKGTISDLGGPTANMYRIKCKSPIIEAACRRPSCVYPKVCENLGTDHGPLIELYQKVRALPGIKKVLIASGVRYDLAIEDPRYIKELVTHHVGGYLKIAPEHLEEGPLSKMMKPGMGTYYRFKELFDKFSREAGKEQFLIPYFIAAHPGTDDEDMLNLSLWLKKQGFKLDQVQTFLPSPMATATAMYHSGKNPLKKVDHKSEDVEVPKGIRRRRLHKAFLRYHDPNNWPVLREGLKAMGRADLIGNGPEHLVPWGPKKGGHRHASPGRKGPGRGQGPARGQNQGPARGGQGRGKGPERSSSRRGQRKGYGSKSRGGNAGGNKGYGSKSKD